ncbi:hypothetical protein LCGC14_0871930 [marine sediment metagenome]|uniref:Uncharacterized protein n=1 Tax=marine sediment metagenome TaxID=412755 RepID=A0A0F9PQ16_9ZZZZ
MDRWTRTKECCENLTDEQVEFALVCMSDWLRLKNEFENAQLSVSDADVDHSSLLRRLLSGKPALPNPPPKCHSCPCYALAEGKPVEVMEVYDNPVIAPGRVSIEQNSQWEWHDKEKQILKHIPSGDLYTLKSIDNKGTKFDWHVLQKVQEET